MSWLNHCCCGQVKNTQGNWGKWHGLWLPCTCVTSCFSALWSRADQWSIAPCLPARQLPVVTKEVVGSWAELLSHTILNRVPLCHTVAGEKGAALLMGSCDHVFYRLYGATEQGKLALTIPPMEARSPERTNMPVLWDSEWTSKRKSASGKMVNLNCWGNLNLAQSSYLWR